MIRATAFTFLAVIALPSSATASDWSVVKLGDPKTALTDIQSVFVCDPVLAHGSSEFPQNAQPIDGNQAPYTLIVSGIASGIENALVQKKYRAIRQDRAIENQSALTLDLLNVVKRMSDAPPGPKSQIFKERHPELVDAAKKLGLQADAVVVVQSFGNYSYLPDPAGTVGVAAATIAVSSALTGVGMFSTGTNTRHDYKITVIDLRKSAYVLYMEGFVTGSDIFSQGRMMMEYEKILGNILPNCARPVTQDKFKKRRSG